MPIQQARYTLGTAEATKVIAADSLPSLVFVHNAEHASSTIVYLGNADVTNANGMHLHSDDTLNFTIGPGDELWAVSAAGTPVLQIMRIVQD